MQHSIRVTVLAGAFALALSSAAHAGVSGTVSVGGMTWTPVDGIAYLDDGELKVALVENKLDRKEVAKDSKVDDFDIMRNDGASVTLPIDAENAVGCIQYSSGGGGGSSCNSDYDKAFHLKARDAKHVAGSFDFTDADGKTHTATFDLPIETTIARAGTALPADGGEPGKAVVAQFAAIASGDFEKLKALSHPERRQMMAESEKSGEAAAMFEFMRAMTPTDVKVTGGTVDGDSAVVDFTGKESGKDVKGTADVEKFEGKWYVTGTNM